MKMYEIAQVYADFMQALEDGLIPDEAVNDTLESIQGEADAKIDAIACICKELNADAAAIREEARKLTERARAKEAHAERLKTYLERFLPALGYGRGKRFESTRTRISWRKTTTCAVDNGFTAWALEHRPDLLKHEPRTVDVKACLKAGEHIEHAELIERDSMSIQ